MPNVGPRHIDTAIIMRRRESFTTPHGYMSLFGFSDSECRTQQIPNVHQQRGTT
jgi:hypothetical protein